MTKRTIEKPYQWKPGKFKILTEWGWGTKRGLISIPKAFAIDERDQVYITHLKTGRKLTDKGKSFQNVSSAKKFCNRIKALFRWNQVTPTKLKLRKDIKRVIRPMIHDAVQKDSKR